MRWIAYFLVALILGSLATPDAASAAEAAASPQEKVCELHIWGAGRPNFVPKSSMLVKVTPDPDPTNPLSNTQLFNTVNRAMALSDDDLRQLFPDATRVIIVRHADMLDTDQTPIKSIRARLAPSDAECYGDFIVVWVSAIFPNPNFQGPLVDAIKGGNRLVVNLWLQRFDGSSAKPVVFKRKNDAPVLSYQTPRKDYAASIAVASDQILRDFAETVAKKRAKR